MTNRQWWQIVGAVVVGMLLAMVVHYVFLKSLAVLSLFGFGLLLAYILDPVLDRLEHHGWSRGAAVSTVMLGFILVLVLAGVLVVPQLVAQVQDAAAHYGEYSQRAQETYQAWRGQLEAYALERFPTLDVMPLVDAKVQSASTWLQDHLPSFLQWVSGQLLASLGAVAMGALLLLISFHFMMVIDPFRRGLREMLPPSADAEMDRVSVEINRMLAQYLRGIVVISVAQAVVATALLMALGLFFGTKYALIIGLVTGVTCMVPYIGPLVSVGAAGIVGYVTTAHGSPLLAALLAAGFMFGQNQVFDSVVTPRIVGRKVGLHPLVVLFAAMVGLALFGVWGMIIATPAAACIKILLARWLPVQGPQVTERAPTARLELDVWGGLKAVRARFSQVRRDLRNAIAGVSDENGDEAADPHPPPAVCPPCPEPDPPAGDQPRPEPHDGEP